MEGRWTIWRGTASGQLLVRTPGFVGDGAVPVVPCDPAAIERAIDALVLEDLAVGEARQFAEIALRAAGETP